MLKKIKRVLKFLLKSRNRGNKESLISGNKNLHIHPTAIFKKEGNVSFGDDCHINEYVIIRNPVGKLIMGNHSHIGPFSVLFTSAHGIIIGNYVMIAPHCVFAAGSHVYDDLSVPMLMAGDFSNGPIIIEDDVWIGANCSVLQNVKIGKGAIIGANSLVNKDVEPYSIVAGIPIKNIGYRKNKTKTE